MLERKGRNIYWECENWFYIKPYQSLQRVPSPPPPIPYPPPPHHHHHSRPHHLAKGVIVSSLQG